MNIGERERIYNPCIVALAGPSYTGKTTLGGELSSRTNFVQLDIDDQGVALAKILGGPHKNWFENSNRMAVKYAHIHRMAGDLLVAGNPVVLTATYSHETYEYALRVSLADTYRRFKGLEEAPLQIFSLDASEGCLAQRVAERSVKGSASDVNTLEHARELRRKFVYMQGGDIVKIDTSKPIEQNIAEILKALEPFRVIT